MLYGVLRQMPEYRNNNIKRNETNEKVNNIPWNRASKERFDSSLYNLTY